MHVYWDAYSGAYYPDYTGIPIQLESRLPVGTPEYIAPEVLTSLDVTADYGVCCDWWSLGIIAYELVYDVTPFTGGSTSETYGNIMNYEVGSVCVGVGVGVGVFE